MLSTKYDDIVYPERRIESSVKHDYSSSIQHVNAWIGLADSSVSIHDTNEVAVSVNSPTK